MSCCGVDWSWLGQKSGESICVEWELQDKTLITVVEAVLKYDNVRMLPFELLEDLHFSRWIVRFDIVGLSDNLESMDTRSVHLGDHAICYVVAILE